MNPIVMAGSNGHLLPLCPFCKVGCCVQVGKCLDARVPDKTAPKVLRREEDPPRTGLPPRSPGDEERARTVASRTKVRGRHVGA